MKKSSLFFLSLSVAVLIAYTSRTQKLPINVESNSKWSTFEKKSHDKIIAHATTDKELQTSRLERKIASTNSTVSGGNPFPLREERILIGDDALKYQDEAINLPMKNTINPEWKDVLGNDLLRFQKEDTKIIIKNELSLIRVKNGEGQFLEQVIITYLQKDGTQNSYHAMVNSETGLVVETWDRTIHEHYNKAKRQLIPSGPSNITGR